LFVAGHSAGGHLAALLALDQSYLARHNLTSRNIAGAIPMSGVYTLEVPVVSRRMIERAFGADPAAAAAASPSSHARASAPPFLLLAAARDTPALRRDGQQMAGALRAKGNHDVTFEVIPGRNHFTLISQMKDPGDAAMQKLVAFVRWLSRG
jgi:acetyl esterase/lipase